MRDGDVGCSEDNDTDTLIHRIFFETCSVFHVRGDLFNIEVCYSEFFACELILYFGPFYLLFYDEKG